MVFHPPEWVPKLPFDPPDSIPIPEFLFDEKWGREKFASSHPPFTCGLTGKEYSAAELRDRVEDLAKGLSKEFGWKPNEGSEWNKVVGVFSLNTIDTATVSWATHRLNGISTPANSAYSLSEVIHQFKSSKATCIFTNVPLLDSALAAAKELGLPRNRVYLINVAPQTMEGKQQPNDLKTVDDLIAEGRKQGALDKLKFKQGQGKNQVAFLCYSSGTSGLPKGVMISHRNIIANVMMATAYDSVSRKHLQKYFKTESTIDVQIALLPFSHIYALVLMCHAGVYRGDRNVVLPKFEMQSFLKSIDTYKIKTLYLVPPILIMMTKNKSVCDKFDLSAVQSIFTGAAPLGKETADDIKKLWPDWFIRQGYGMTESATLTTSTATIDIDFGSSGCLISGVEGRIVTPEGKEITEYDQPGELLLRCPSVVLGYLNNPEATRETFQDGWLRTGDEAIIRKSPKGNEHVWIVDRIKELIKVKGFQVAPAELEAHLLTHEAVADCTVIPVPDERAGEVPKAFVVRASGSIEDNASVLARDIRRHVEKSKSRPKWLDGGVEFVDTIPKSASGKILRRMLRDKEKEKRRKAGAKI